MALQNRLEQKPAGMNMDLDNERRRAVEAYNATTDEERRRLLYWQVEQIDSFYGPEETSHS